MYKMECDKNWGTNKFEQFTGKAIIKTKSELWFELSDRAMKTAAASTLIHYFISFRFIDHV